MGCAAKRPGKTLRNSIIKVGVCPRLRGKYYNFDQYQCLLPKPTLPKVRRRNSSNFRVFAKSRPVVRFDPIRGFRPNSNRANRKHSTFWVDVGIISVLGLERNGRKSSKFSDSCRFRRVESG